MRLSLEVEINQFRLKEQRETPERPVELSDSETEFDRFFTAYSPRLLVARVGTSFEEEEGMTLNSMKDLKDLVVERNKGSSSKEASRTQLPPNPPLLSLPSLLGLHPDPNLQKKKRKEKEIKEGRLPRRRAQSNKKQTKIDKGRLQ